MTRGQLVACVDDIFPKWVCELYTALPVKGDVYTIREVCLRRETLVGSDAATVAVLLEELVNPPDPRHRDGEELAFRSERFAPLISEEIEHHEEAHELV